MFYGHIAKAFFTYYSDLRDASTTWFRLILLALTLEMVIFHDM